MMASKSPEVLTPEERLLFTTIPDDLSAQEMAHFYTLSPEDLRFIRRFRNDENKLGVALQLCTLRHPGRPLMTTSTVSERVVVFVADQLKLPPAALARYGDRPKTLYDHLKEIRQQYGYRPCTEAEGWPLIRHLVSLAMETDEATPLVAAAMAWMRRRKVIAPSILTTEKAVWLAQRVARRRVYGRMTRGLSREEKQALEGLLIVTATKGSETPLAWLRIPAGKPSPKGMYHLLERITFLNELQLPPPAEVHPARYRQLAQRGRRYKPDPLANLRDQRERHALLLAYLHEWRQELIDQLLDMFDRWLTDLLRKGSNKQRHYLHQNISLLNRNLNILTLAADALLQAKREKKDPFEMVFAVVDERLLEETVISATTNSRPADMDFRDLVENTFVRRRKAMLEMVRTLSFQAIADRHSVLEALDHVLHLLDEYGERVRTEEFISDREVLTAPLEHLKRKRWKRHALTEEGINPNYYELAAFDRLRDAVRSGDITVAGSRRYRSYEEYWMPLDEWERLKKQGETGLAVPDDPRVYLKESQEQIAELLAQVGKLIATEDSHLFLAPDGSLHQQRLEKVTPAAVESLRRRLYSYVPWVEMSQMIVDVDRWTGFLDSFTHLLSGRPPARYHKAVLIAALMEAGMNLGPTKMAQASEFTTRELTQQAEWHIREETLRLAQAELDNFVLHHPFSRHWGSGTTSSSDGMRIPVVVSAANALLNARYFWNRRGITIMTHAADIWMPFYPQVLEDAREALYVLDALCHHETDFDIKEHYTDTASATYHLFALCKMLGFRFAPRIRGVTRKYLFTVEPLEVDKALRPLVKGEIESDLVVQNWDAFRRSAASIRHGVAPASVLMRKLGSYPQQNQLAKALNEMGKLERTIFVLSYLGDIALQRRNRRGLNKGEAIFSAARAIGSGRQGESYDREWYAQMNRASSLMLLVSILSTWNTVYLDKVVTSRRKAGAVIPDEHLAHVSPLGWQHVNLLGRYEVDLDRAFPLNDLRPLRKPVDG
jgi:TnpA family transposase